MVLLLGFCCRAAGARDDLPELFKATADAPWRVTADEMVYDRDADEIRARGNVRIEKEGIRIAADTVRYQRATGSTLAEGNVRMHVGEDSFSGSRVALRKDGETGALFDGTLFIKRSNFHIRADKIEKTGPRTYAGDQVVVTTCDGTSPDWRIAGKHMEVTLEGYGVVNHAAFWVKDLPVFYTPILAFPVKLERQSGFLTPEMGQSDRRGFEYLQPFFWAVSDASDLTLYAHVMSERGEKWGAEYRYLLSDRSRGVAMIDVLDDDKVDDGTGTTAGDYGYAGDAVSRPNTDRYWFRMKHDQVLGEHAKAVLDLDIVSDQDYLQEFKSGYTGFRSTEDFFLDFSGRELDDYNDPVRKNRLNVSKQWTGASLNVEALWYDDVVARRWGGTDETVQRLPVINFDRYKQPLFATAFYGDLETQAGYFYREDGTRGFRADVHPRIYLPLRPGGGVTVEPSVGLRQTMWHVDGFDSDTDAARTRHRSLYDVRLDVSTELYKVYAPRVEGVEGLKHAMKFQTIYDYVPEQNQTDLPYYDDLDRIDGQNEISWSVTNTFTTRTSGKNGPVYHQVGRFKLEQGFDIGKENDGEPEPFTPLQAEAELDLAAWCRVQGDAQWSVYGDGFLSRNIAGRFADARGDRLFVEHRYTRDRIESVYADALVRLTDRVWLFSDYERNIREDTDLRTGFGGLFQAQCWSVELAYEEEEGDRSFRFLITLFGLGDMGGDGRRMPTTVTRGTSIDNR